MNARLMISLTVMAASATLSMPASSGPPGTPPGVTDTTDVVPAATVGPKTLKKTWIGSGNGNGAALPQFAFTTVQTSTVSCGNTAGCTIGIESMAQIQPKGGDWAICLLVDGVSTSCQYQGVQAGPSSYVVGNARGVKTGVAQGSHTVTTQLYAEGSGATYAYYQTDVRVYTP